MRNVWVISGIRQQWMSVFEYYTSEEAAEARVSALLAEDRHEYEEIDQRVDLEVTWEEYREIQDVGKYEIELVPHVESVNSEDDRIVQTGGAPAERIWLILEDGRPEEERFYFTTEEDAKDDAWSRNWARWERYDVSEEGAAMTFAQYRNEMEQCTYGYTPADPGPVPA